MFSIAAINDTDSKGQWEPLAPTKEAQEFHLSQTYHEGLLKLQAKEYEKACELLEAVLKDPLLPSGQVDNCSSDVHLLQLRFLALKNLATVFLQQGSAHYEKALHCYLQAVEIDSKDSVVWNQLGTLSCSMGLLSISRWAFEQGLVCSPNNWNCMEKLLEVLIAIGDEVACLSVTELILRHWPSHCRALHVKSTIEESEPTPFTPRGIDKLEPKHVRLKFLDKRKATNDDLDDSIASKKLNQNIELLLPEASWIALTCSLLEILVPLDGFDSKQGVKEPYRSTDIRLIIHLPDNSESVVGFMGRKGAFATPAGENVSCGDSDGEKCSVSREREASLYEEQHQERRSSRLERLRSRKPSKEELDYASSKDLAKVVIQSLGPFVIGGSETRTCNGDTSSSHSAEVVTDQLNSESVEVAKFVREASKNYGAYHMGHLLLEAVACRSILYQDSFVKFLELEKVTRHWGQNRSPECNIFLAELYYDFASRSSDSSMLSTFMSEASYHLCKIIEFVALDYPFPECVMPEKENSTLRDGSQSFGSLMSNKRSFWVRFFWLSGQLSVLDGDKAKAQKEFGISLSLLTAKESGEESPDSICLPHCKVLKELTADRVLHEINLLEIDFLLKRTVGNLIEKDLYAECVSLLAPLLFGTKDANLGKSCAVDKEGEGIAKVELSALDVLIKACEKTEAIGTEVFLKCHRRKLQILMAAAGMEECLASQKSFNISRSKALAASETEITEGSSNHWHHLVSEEVKEISRYASQMKTLKSPCGNSKYSVARMGIIGDIQSLLLALVCNIACIYFSKKASVPGDPDHNEQEQKCCFIDAAIAFFKLQHLNPNVPVKTQIELIVAIHDMLAEYGICCAGGDGEEEGAFLKLAIKHLLALDMKLKSNSLSSGLETTQTDEQSPQKVHAEPRGCDLELDSGNVEVDLTGMCETRAVKKDATKGTTINGIFSQNLEKEKNGVESAPCAGHKPDPMFCEAEETEEASNEIVECVKELTEDEREELEMGIDSGLDQCFFCLYGLHLRSDSSYEDDLAMHKNTSRGDYQTKEQCADVFQYILPYAKASSRTGLVKLRRVLRAIRKHFPQPPDNVLAGNAIDKFLDDPDLCEDKLSEAAGSDGFLDAIMKIIFPDAASLKPQTTSVDSSEPFLEVYGNLYYLLSQSEEISATDKWPGFVLTKEGEEFVQHNSNLFKYDLLYNPHRFESWQRLANIYDEEVDLLLNDGSKQINVQGWRKNPTLPQRVDTSRRRSRRCLLMTLALAKTAVQQGEIHELLALVYYDGLQNVVPIYDQRLIVPSKDAAWMMFCQNSMRHFEKAFSHKEDWSHAYYLGKLSEKLGYSHVTSFAYYEKAIALNPSAVDPFYRMHASRLKLLYTRGKKNNEALKVVAAYSFSQSIKESALSIIGETKPESSLLAVGIEESNTKFNFENVKQVESHQMEELWHILYSDCLSALQICVEGDLKHFHKARFMLAQGLYKRDESGDQEKAKDELSFCFKSSRSCFTINMWEIDGMVKKGRRKTPGLSGNRKALEVNLPESSRKFITCIRKYILLYMKLLDETRDISTLDRAYISLRADKRFSLCLEDLVPVALGRYIKALISSIHQIEICNCSDGNSLDNLLEKMFSLFMEQMNLWSDVCNLHEIKSPELSESSLYGYLYQYIQILEKNAKVETLEGINEKMRKRLKNPKLSNSNCAKVYKHVSVAWCRSLVFSMALISPLNSRLSSDMQAPHLSDSGSGNTQLLCVDIQTDEFWKSSFEDPHHLKSLEIQWSTLLSKFKNVVIKKASEEDLETATVLLRSSYNFYRDASCALLPSGVNLFGVSSQLPMETYTQPLVNTTDILEMSTPKKILMWAYTLLHGRCSTNFSVITKYCEETAKSKMKKGSGSSSVPSSISMPSGTASHTGGGKDGAGKCNEQETALISTAGDSIPERVTDSAHRTGSTSVSETKTRENVDSSKPETGSMCNVVSASLHEAEGACNETGSKCNVVAASLHADSACNVAFTNLPEDENDCGPNGNPSGNSQ